MITDWLKALSQFSSTDPVQIGVTRVPYSRAQKDAAFFILRTMKDLGMDAAVDPYGTVAGIYPGRSSQCILFGSHYDSVREGGMYDGCTGIALGLEVIRRFRESGEIPPCSIAVAAMNDEEGVLFQKSFLSSKTICGEYQEEDYLSLISRENGRSAAELAAEWTAEQAAAEWTAEQASAASTAGPAAPAASGSAASENSYTTRPIRLDTFLKDVICYIEPHIEQGPVLDHEQISFGLVEHIVGLFHCFYTVRGESNHAGTTPMHLRRDPLPAVGWLISKIPQIALSHPGSVATVGSVTIRPNVVNVIADEVTFSLDIRSVDRTTLDEMKTQLEALVEEAHALYPNLSFTQEHGYFTSGVTMDPRLVSRLEQSLLRSGCSFCRMDSGAGHDAQIFALHLPAAMLFLPSRGGYSHSRREFTEEIYLDQAADILKDFCSAFTGLEPNFAVPDEPNFAVPDEPDFADLND